MEETRENRLAGLRLKNMELENLEEKDKTLDQKLNEHENEVLVQ